MNQTWVTADLHLGHEKAAAMRGFASAEKHDQYIVNMWNSLIDPTDVVWVLGDVTLDPWRMNRPGPFLTFAELPGGKRLIHGNHDPSHPMHRSALKADVLALLDEVFEWYGTTHYLRYQGVPMLLNHFPYGGDSQSTDRYTQWRLRDHGVPIVHGHTHWTQRYTLSMKGTEQIHVGLDAWGLAPVHIEDVLLTLSSRGEIP